MLLVDTNILLAAVDVSAVEHDRCARLLEEHQDLTVTAAVAGRPGASTIATLNRRDLAVVRPVHVAAFELLPCNPSRSITSVVLRWP